ncbi:hypothetical protein VTJ04DRAFT_8983 [Mycothermus thermophilus]|uniref:uncharacterized protein n=1 Tax=Humicola insolens TaxID=85995 RepID=UPI0037425900
MSYTGRSADAYARRPTDDRSRDTAYADDRRRRSTDASMKDPRDPAHGDDRRRRSTDVSTKDSKDDSFKPRSLQRKHSSGTADGSGREKSHGHESLVKLFRKYAEETSELARLKADRAHMNKILKTRQAEYERSLAKHAELYPSVPEMQNMSRMKYAGHVANLDLQIQKIQRNADAIAEAISQALVGSVREGEMRTSVTSPSFQIHPQQESIIELKAENAELKSKFHQLQANWEQERAEHLKVLRQMQEEMKKMEKMRTEMKNLEKDKEKELEVAKKLKEETERNVKDVKDQLSRMQKDHKQTSDELAARLSKQEQASVKATQDCGDIKALVDREASAWKSAISDITTDISELTSRVESLSTPPAQDVSEAANIDSNVVADLTRQIKEHESKLSRLDADALERVAETIDIKIPALESKLSSLQEKVDIGIPEALDKKEQDIFKQVVNYVQIMSEYLGKKVDSINDALKGIKNRVEALEQASTSGQTASVNNDQLQQLISEVSSLKSKLEPCEQAIQKLDKELRNQIQQANQATSTLGQDLNGQLDAVRQSLFVLNSQYNNLTTRSLAEHIIGYLRQMYPQSDQLIADIKALNLRVGAVQADLEGIKVKYDERSLAPESNGCANGNDAQVAGAKRKRLDSTTANGLKSPRLANGRLANGANASSADGR